MSPGIKRALQAALIESTAVLLGVMLLALLLAWWLP